MKTYNIQRDTYLLNDLAKIITLKDNSYCLAGIVSYIKCGSGFNNLHITSHLHIQKLV